MTRSNVCSDVLIVGGGVIGLTTALKLAQDGVSVLVCDRQESGREASWAGAGMLPPGNLPYAATPEARLRSYSAELWKEFSVELRETTGIDNGHRVCGAVEFCAETDAESQGSAAMWNSERLRIETLDAAGIEKRCGAASLSFTEALFLPDFAQVRNPRHLKALYSACQRVGVQFAENVGDIRFIHDGNRIAQIQSAKCSFSFEKVCITAGAWSAGLLNQLEIQVPVKPVRGQIVLLRNHGKPIPSVVELGRRYIVPRDDGLVLVGSTQEDAGFEKRNTAEGVRSLIQLAEMLCPALREAEVVRCWSGLRPASIDELPLIGAFPQFNNLFAGTGHFRSGLQMSIGTSMILRELLQSRPSPVSLSGLEAHRFSN
ncbi:MAG: glycine oxidase ThiO [Planctomycetaceae bacterium]|nr:glycine oxidase ThiO [Planctomycetaceae bacterium]